MRLRRSPQGLIPQPTATQGGTSGMADEEIVQYRAMMKGSIQQDSGKTLGAHSRSFSSVQFY